MANDTNVQIPAPFNKWYTIREAAEAMEYKHPQYVRKLLKEGKLGEYVEVKTDENGPVLTPDGAFIVESGSKIKLLVGKVETWYIDPAACEEHKAKVAQGTSTFGQHAVRRMLLRFSTEHFTVEQIQDALKAALGPATVGEGDDSFRWEFTKAWKGGSKKAKPKKPGAPRLATIVGSLTAAEVEDDDEDYDFDDEDEDDNLTDILS